MIIKDEKQQLGEESHRLKDLIDWQAIKVRQAQKKYNIKKNWIISFWIGSDADVLNFVLNYERDIIIRLIAYKKIIDDRLMNCKEEKEYLDRCHPNGI